jgi:uncharacterized membrane protein
MSQMPPPPPGQPEPAPMQMPAAGGGNANLYTILAWALLPPIGSFIFLFVGKDDPDVKYNAAQAFIVHGGAFVVWAILRILAQVSLFFGFVLIFWLLIWFIIWLVGLIVALQAGGKRLSYPVLGPMVQQYIPIVEGWAR